jgi:hypothetical protein
MKPLFVLLALASATLSCGRSPTGPTPAQQVTASQSSGMPKPDGPRIVSGTVLDQVDGRPVSGANVNAWVQIPGFAYSYMWANGARYSDEVGRYRLESIPDGAQVNVQVWKAGYAQQCAAPRLLMTADASLDVSLVLKTALSADIRSLPPMPAGYRAISGVIFENTPAGRHPLAGAFVDYEPFEDFPAAMASSDQEGRYVLCGIPTSESATISASMTTARVAYVTAPPGQTTGVDIEIPPEK